MEGFFLKGYRSHELLAFGLAFLVIPWFLPTAFSISWIPVFSISGYCVWRLAREYMSVKSDGQSYWAEIHIWVLLEIMLISLYPLLPYQGYFFGTMLAVASRVLWLAQGHNFSTDFTTSLMISVAWLSSLMCLVLNPFTGVPCHLYLHDIFLVVWVREGGLTQLYNSFFGAQGDQEHEKDPMATPGRKKMHQIPSSCGFCSTSRRRCSGKDLTKIPYLEVATMAYALTVSLAWVAAGEPSLALTSCMATLVGACPCVTAVGWPILISNYKSLPNEHRDDIKLKAAATNQKHTSLLYMASIAVLSSNRFVSVNPTLVTGLMRATSAFQEYQANQADLSVPNKGGLWT